MRLNELLDDLKLNMTIYSFLGEIMSVIDCGEELNRAPPAYIDRIIRDAHKEVNGDIPPQESFRALVEILIKEGCTYSILLSDLPLQCPSAISFHVPVNITSLIDDAPIIFYKVESRKNEELVDIVAIYPNGSICSTGSNFANYGLPCELEMAVFLAGKIHINMCLNFHPICQEPHLKDLGVKML